MQIFALLGHVRHIGDWLQVVQVSEYGPETPNDILQAVHCAEFGEHYKHYGTVHCMQLPVLICTP